MHASPPRPPLRGRRQHFSGIQVVRANTCDEVSSGSHIAAHHHCSSSRFSPPRKVGAKNGDSRSRRTLHFTDARGFLVMRCSASDPSAGPAERVWRLFLALLPDEDVRRALARAAVEAGMPRDSRLRQVNPRRYHATMHFLGGHSSPRPDLVAAVERVAGSVHGMAFDWRLDRLRSFGGRHPPRVLCCSVPPEALQRLWRQWREGLLQEVPGSELDECFVPHVTLAYGRVLLPEKAVSPVHWPVRELALLESRAGQRDYRTLASWPLQQA
ncbi:2'-5' RNA ligase family protein [Rhodanobacter sp. Si-c]|uniref:RNA 2',3'-cyclic phosphodiesterase n=1 Tax=Rhodanobacter lycopersici TaxID=3162487 RepID=A0ABV3QAH3_9GAMM